MSARLDPLKGAFVDLSARTKLRITGEDRLRYLNGQITNDLRKATDAAPVEACILNAKGKIEGHVFIRPNDQSFLLDAAAELREDLTARLERYVIADDVEIADVTDDLSIFHVLARPDLELPQTKLISVNRFGVAGFDVWIERSKHDEMFQILAALIPFCDDAGREVLRIEQGIPRWGRELTSEIIPVEANLEQRCVDYEKGCYVGQEVISRMKMSGQRNKALFGLIAEQDSTLVEGKRFVGDDARETGWITSVADSERFGRRIALGYIKRGAVAPPGVAIVDLPFSTEHRRD